MKTNHPAHGPVSLNRLHQISEILSKAAAQSDGGNLGYAMADAVKVIDGVLESIASEQVRCEHAAWSQATFGGVGPVGPLKHLSKELAKLFRKITNSEIDAEGNAHVILSPADSLLINNARIALASLEAEAVAYMHHSGQVVTREECCDDKIFAICCKVETPLYAAPQLPQPVVLSVSEGVLKSLLPDVEKSEFWFEHNGKIFFEGVRFNNAVFEACRAAMLQAGKYPVTPDGWQLVPKEPTEAMNKAGWAAMNEHDAINPTYRAMLAAAPQQENV